MLAYGICIGKTDKFITVCQPTIPSGSPVLVRRGQESIYTAYNSIIEEALELDQLEALVLLHDDVALGQGFEDDVRRALSLGADIVGAVGARNPRSIAWWEGEKKGKAIEPTRVFDYGGGVHEVDTVDGLIMVLSRAAVTKLRFDDARFSGFHGYDIDLCSTARLIGMNVVVAPLDLVHHSKGSLGDVNAWRKADLEWRRKWRHISAIGYIAGRAALQAHIVSHATRRLRRRLALLASKGD